MTLSDANLRAIEAIERSCSVLSLFGSLFIIVTFCTSKAFHKPINRLVFYASFGNMMTNVGTLMARMYISAPASAGCQFQSFIIQMFMPADAFWTLAMAINVYLTFYYKFDGRKLRRMEWPYLITCYGIPFIPAMVYLLWQDSQGRRIYGNATLWCWVAPEYGVLRLATFYGPVWIIILATFFIYVRAGRTIYEKRRQLQEFDYTDPDSSSPWNGIKPVKTTEVKITHEVVEHAENSQHIVSGRDRRFSNPMSDTSPDRTYTITISANPDPFNASAVDDRIPPSPTPGFHLQRPPTSGHKRTPSIETTTTTSRRQHRMSTHFVSRKTAATTTRRKNYELNNAAWAYTKCAILFFTALLVTWIPSSANRVFSFVHAKRSFAPLEFMSAFVLPLQGFWNAVIYISTSWRACKMFFGPEAHWKGGNRPDWGDMIIGKVTDDGAMIGGREGRDREQAGVHLPQLRLGKFVGKSLDTESMAELATAGSRDHSDDERRA